ncbi:zinc-dependent metalloprotease [Lewinella sp. IMCC34191]|uniref:zinc-dependent metalloprotease n=1 Tax=Lewinella sp. IMCC34191 TaxID=2259172 RepID=UPI0013007ED7|nr:zinc-dependent metalloprotease [Lewinella sp. IMCC34191]
MSVRLPLIFVLSFLALRPLFAQNAPPENACATPGYSPWLEAYHAGKIARRPKSVEVQYVPVHLTLLGDDDGFGYADPLTVLKSFEFLNEDFAKINVRFFIDNEIDYLNSTAYYDHEFDGGNELMRNYNRDNMVNSYIVGRAAGACGYYSPSADGVVLDIDCINGIDRTWSHELGHFFGLRHTFYGWESFETNKAVEDAYRDSPAPATLSLNGRTVEVERVDGSNCQDAADGFCDTSPDYLPERWRCEADGNYLHSFQDPDGTAFEVPASNIMSYAFDGCVEQFSEEQITAMNTNLGTNRIGLASTVVPEFTAAKAEDIDLLAPENFERVPYSDVVDLVWNRVPNADFYLVQVNSTGTFGNEVTYSFFTSDTTATVRDILAPQKRYYWRVRPVNRYDVSGDFSATYQFFNGAVISTATMDPALDAAIAINPNPVAPGQSFLVTGNRLGHGTADWQLYDAAGRIAKEQRGIQVTGDLSATVPTNDLTPGIYFFRLSLEGRMVTRRLVVTP